MAGPVQWSPDLADNHRRYGVESEEAARNTLAHSMRAYQRTRDPQWLNEASRLRGLLGEPEPLPEQAAQPQGQAPAEAMPQQPVMQAPQPGLPAPMPRQAAPVPQIRQQPPRTAAFASPGIEDNGVLPREPADLAKVDRNLARLIAQKAPDAHIKQYLDAEGTTVAAVMEYKSKRQQMGTVGRIANDVGEFIQDAPRNIYNYIAGEEDPRNRKLGDIYQPNVKGPDGAMLMSPSDDIAGLTDDQALDIAKKRLGNRFIGVEKDSRGRPVINFQGDNGPERAYINKPGLEATDVNRALGGAIPYLAAAGLAGRVGGGVALQTGLQGAAAGGTSVAQDAAAQLKGSERGIDPWRAGLAAGGAMVGQVVGAVAFPFLKRWASSREIVDDTGKLTARGRQLASREGLNPDDIDGDLARYISSATATAKDKAEGLVSAQTGQFGIPTTKGQRLKDPQLLLSEKDARFGTLGKEAKDVMQSFDREQTQAITRAALGDPSKAAQSRSIAPVLAPNRTPSALGQQEIGESIRGGLNSAQAGGRAAEKAAWDKVGPLHATPEALERLPQFLLKELGNRRLDPKVTPTAYSMADDLNAFFKGDEMRSGLEVLKGQPGKPTIDEMRRRLYQAVGTASTPGDKTAAGKLYSAFNGWIDDTAAANLLRGDPASALALREARAVSREVKGLFKPRDAGGLKAPAARIFEQMVAADSGEGVIKALFGTSGPKATAPNGVVDAVKRYEQVTKRFAGKAGEDAWNDVRVGYWLKLVMDNKGNVASPGNLANSLEAVMANRKSLMEALYKPHELMLMRQYAAAVRSASYKDPNPSGSGAAVRALVPDMVKQALNTQAQRETFSKHNVIMSRIYRALAKAVPNIAGGKDAIGGRIARGATSQTVTQSRPPAAGGLYGGLSGYGSQDQRNNAPLNALSPAALPPSR